MLVIGNGRVVTRDPEMPMIEDGAVLCEGGLIKEVGKLSELKKKYPDVRTAIELGGQDAKIIFFHKDGATGKIQVSDMRMNGTCAGGTGAFIDEAAAILPHATQKEANRVTYFSKEAALALKARALLYAASPLFNGNPDYSTLRFRRIGMGMYSFRLYDQPLTPQQQDSINADDCLIVYNDSTVFEFGGGAFGIQHFVGKDEFLKDLH